jgi:hypothetical protein
MTRTRTSNTTSRPGSTRTTGMVVAVGVGLAAAGLIGYVALTKPRPEDAPRDSTRAPLPADLAALATSGNSPAASNQTAEGVRIELADKKDPTRIATILTARSVTPREGRSADVTEPGAIVFLKDGRTLRIRAATGTFSSFSADQAPERGTFKGKVRADLYAPGVSPRTTEWDSLSPIASSDFGDLFDFDMTFGRILIPGAFVVRADGLEIRGTDATLVLDETAAALRSALIARDFAATRVPDTTIPATSPAKNEPAAPTSAGASPTPATDAMYRVTMSTPVSIIAGADKTLRTIDADKAFAFLRLVNNRLRPNAIARIETTAKPEASSPASSSTTTVTSGDEPFTLRTTGPVEIKLATDTPPELAANDLALRLEGTAKPVRFADAGAKSSGHSPVVEYAATKGDLTLIGSAPDSVSLNTAGNGSLASQWLTLNLPTKVGQMRGPGSVQDVSKPATGEPVTRRVTWADQADFGLAATGKRSSWEIAWTKLFGGMTGTDGKSAVSSDSLAVDFAPGSQPTRAKLDGGAAVRADKASVLSASSMDLAFRTLATGKTEPSLLTAKGTVEARDSERFLSSELLEAEIARNDKNALAATKVLAKGSVSFSSGAADAQSNRQIVAAADELRANIPLQQADLIGKEASITQQGSAIYGELIKLDGVAKSLKVQGPGHFEAMPGEPGGKGLLAARASWGDSMSFDDTTGVLEALGGARASAMPDEFTIDTISAERVTVRTARKPAAEATDKPAAGALNTGDREIVSLTAEGSQAAPAKAEARRYNGVVNLDSVADRRVERLQYLEGSTIIADVAQGTLNVPGKGRSLVLDRTAAANSPVAPSATPTSFRGTALFEWTDAMTFTRSSGVLDLKGAGGGVKITSDNTRDDSVVFIQSDAANATLTGLDNLGKPTGQPGESSARAQLNKAEAIGSVFGRFKSMGSERELNAHRAFYDATASLLTIEAKEGDEVSLFDAATATPVRAAELRWDLANDRVEIVKPSPITTPR